MAVRASLVLGLAVAVSACGGAATPKSSYNCDEPAQHQCSAVSLNGEAATDQTCVDGTVVTACAATGVVGRCTFSLIIPTGVQLHVVNYYSSDVIAAGKNYCNANAGTWTTP